jgi:hypothetical protein
MKLIEKIVLLIVLIAAVGGYLYYKGEIDFDFFDDGLTSKQCLDEGGEIVNSLTGECETHKIGDITDLRCPCVCCASS